MNLSFQCFCCRYLPWPNNHNKIHKQPPPLSFYWGICTLGREQERGFEGLPLITLPSYALWDQVLVVPGGSCPEQPKLCSLLAQQQAVTGKVKHQLRAKLAFSSPSFEARLIPAWVSRCSSRY